MLKRNAVHPGKNMQPRREFGERSYGGRRGQITWRAGGNTLNRGENIFSRGGNQLGPWRDPNAMYVDREKGGG